MRLISVLLLGTSSLFVAGTATAETPAACTRAVSAGALQQAIDTATSGAVVCVEDGIVSGPITFDRRFSETTTFRTARPYGVVIEHSDTVVRFSSAANVSLEGFRIRHTPGGTGYVVLVRAGTDDPPSEHIRLRGNIIHDSYDNDLLKIHNGTRHAVVEGNLFYNQGPNEQHLDVNSVTDVAVRGNVLFNDYAAAGRATPTVKHFIVVKDSNEDADGILGSERITISDNVFLNWQGGDEAWIAVGNDGKPYHEAEGVAITNNLFLGNSRVASYTPLQVMGARDVVFSHNQVLGDLPSRYYGYRIGTKGDNPPNERIALTGNVWADPTGTMGNLGRVETTSDFSIRGNTYWNGGNDLPPEAGADPERRTGRVDVPEQDGTVLPVWDDGFPSGNRTIGEEHARLVATYGADGAPGGPGRFSDVRGTTHEEAIAAVAEAGIAEGFPDGTYRPGLAVSRGQMAAFLQRALDLPPGDDHGFSDVRGTTHEEAIAAAAEAGIAEGFPDGTYRPGLAVSRGQMAAFLQRALDL